MLVPHRRQDAELRERRLAADQLQDALVFVRLETVTGDEFRGDFRFVGNHAPALAMLTVCNSAPVYGHRRGRGRDFEADWERTFMFHARDTAKSRSRGASPSLPC